MSNSRAMSIDDGEESQQKARNRASDKELTALIEAYRNEVRTPAAKVAGPTDGKALGPAGEKFMVALYAFIDRIAGVTQYRNDDGEPYRQTIGWLARTRGLSDRAQELADRMKMRLENKMQREGEYLSKWDGAQASIATYVTNMGKLIAQTMGEEARAGGVPYESSTNEHSDLVEVDGETGENGESPETLSALSKATVKTQAPVFESMDGDGQDHAGAAKEANVAPSTETPLASALRVDKLVRSLTVVAHDMPGNFVLLNGNRKPLTVNHKNVWLAYLGLREQVTTEDAQSDKGDKDQVIRELDASTRALAERFGKKDEWIKDCLSACFVFYIQHRLFDQTIDLMLPNRLIKHMDKGQIQQARTTVEELAKKTSKEIAQPRKKWVSLIHQWIANHN